MYRIVPKAQKVIFRITVVFEGDHHGKRSEEQKNDQEKTAKNFEGKKEG
jgi:hypothetical protein